MSLASRYYHASLTYAKRHLSQLDPDYYPLPIQIQVMQIKDRSDRKGRDILSPRKEAAKRKNELVIQTFLCSFRDIIYNISYVTVTIVRSEKRRRRSGEGGKRRRQEKLFARELVNSDLPTVQSQKILSEPTTAREMRAQCRGRLEESIANSL